MPSFGKGTFGKIQLQMMSDDVLGFKDSLQITAPVFTTFVVSLFSVAGIDYTPLTGDASHSNL